MIHSFSILIKCEGGEFLLLRMLLEIAQNEIRKNLKGNRHSELSVSGVDDYYYRDSRLQASYFFLVVQSMAPITESEHMKALKVE